MARPSRPPGFDMTYRPKKATFGPPWSARLPATLYFALASAIGIAVLVAPYLSPSTWLYRFVVDGDYHRVVSSTSCAVFLFVSALAAILRQQMSGVVVHPDGIETREVAFGMPRMKKYVWTQIDRVVIPTSPEALRRSGFENAPGSPKTTLTKLRIDLWDGTNQYLPEVARLDDLAVMIERVALARAIPVEGGSGMLDELGNPFGDESDDELPAEA